MYKDGEHETVMANVDTTIFLGSILTEDKEAIQKLLGKTTIRQKSTSSSNSGLSTSYTPTEVSLMSIDEISAINQNGRDDELVIIRDVTPYLCRKLLLTEHRRFGLMKESKKNLGEDFKLKDYYENSRGDDSFSPTAKKSD
jgi:type IV secretory pathway TraG/TraD family ATPase VirD4